jgi:carbohydrate kinase (thermoresistant glucokinase family)
LVRVIVMGVAGCGKSTVGRALASRFGVPFLEGDDLHSEANKAKIHRGEPLDDADRAPWLAAVNEHLRQAPGGLVVACSALTNAYRDRLREGVDDLQFAYLDVPREVLAQRLAHRHGHFAGPAILESQLALLEPPAGEITVDGTEPVDQIVDDVASQVDDS